MNDFLTSIDGLATTTSLVALLFTIVTLFLEKRTKKSQEKSTDSMMLRINGKKIEVSGKDKETLNKILGVTGGEFIFVEKVNEKELNGKQD